MLIGYLPVTKLKCFTEKQRSNVTHQLFHQCMESLLELLKNAGKDGMEMMCADGWVHNVYPILTAYSGLQKHCNILQFRIVCSVALYGMEITLSIIERK
jgi:Plavaka transposase